MRTITVDIELWNEQLEYLSSLEWSLENETITAIVNLFFVNHKIILS